MALFCTSAVSLMLGLMEDSWILMPVSAFGQLGHRHVATGGLPDALPERPDWKRQVTFQHYYGNGFHLHGPPPTPERVSGIPGSHFENAFLGYPWFFHMNFRISLSSSYKIGRKLYLHCMGFID